MCPATPFLHDLILVDVLVEFWNLPELMEFFSVVVNERWPTTESKLSGRYLSAETMYSSIYLIYFCKNKKNL